MRKVLRFAALALGGLAGLIVTVWAAGALYFDFPIAWLRAPLALIYCLVVLAGVLLVKGWRPIRVVVAGFIVVLAWWVTIKPTEDRVWQPDAPCLGGHSGRNHAA